MGANVSWRSVRAKRRIRGRFVALERNGDKGRVGAGATHCAASIHSASSRDSARAIAGVFCSCALPIPEEGPLGTISVRFTLQKQKG